MQTGRILPHLLFILLLQLPTASWAASKALLLYESALDALMDGDDATFTKQMQQAGRANFPPALNDLGLMYQMGFKVEKDLNKALGFYQRSANRKYRSAMFNLGLMHYKGEGTNQSYAQANKWFTQAAWLGDADALYNLGVMAYQGDTGKEDFFQAYVWFAIAARLGSRRGLDARNRLSMDMTLERIAEGDAQAQKFLKLHETKIKNYQE